jgi:hypothetical protein
MVRRRRAGNLINPADVIRRENVESLVAGADDYYEADGSGRSAARVLPRTEPGGIACFSEPGRYHSTTDASQADMANFRVLENDIVLEAIWQLARDAGFADVDIRPMLDGRTRCRWIGTSRCPMAAPASAAQTR